MWRRGAGRWRCSTAVRAGPGLDPSVPGAGFSSLRSGLALPGAGLTSPGAGLAVTGPDLTSSELSLARARRQFALAECCGT